jgi:hypothetical protein
MARAQRRRATFAMGHVPRCCRQRLPTLLFKLEKQTKIGTAAPTHRASRVLGAANRTCDHEDAYSSR